MQMVASAATDLEHARWCELEDRLVQEPVVRVKRTDVARGSKNTVDELKFTAADSSGVAPFVLTHLDAIEAVVILPVVIVGSRRTPCRARENVTDPRASERHELHTRRFVRRVSARVWAEPNRRS